MQKLAFLVASASLFAIVPIAGRFGVVVSSLALVWLSVLVAVVASGRVESMTVASGAIGAFLTGILGPEAPAAGGALLMALAFAERSSRVRTMQGRAVHVLLALVSGAIAGSLSTSFAASSSWVYGVAVVVSAMLTAAPLLISADDPVAHALEQAANGVTGPVRRSLEEGAELRRQAVLVTVERDDDARLRSTWTSLLRLAEARVRLERSRRWLPLVPSSVGAEVKVGPTVAAKVNGAASVAAEVNGAPSVAAEVNGVPSSVAAEGEAKPKESAKDAVLTMVDQRIKDHVLALERAYSAVDTAHAAKAGIDDAAQKAASSMGDSLEEVSRALVEVRSESSS